MKTSVIIVSWNTRNLLRRCLESIFKFTKDIDFDVWVVDNFSSDGTVEMIKNDFPQVNLIANDTNLGFSRANNQPLDKGVGEELLFMNPDMEFTENSIKIMHDFLDQHPEAAIVTCMLKYPDKTRQNNIKRLPGFWSQLLILLKMHHFFGFLPIMKNYLAKDFDYNREQPAENIMGAFVYTRTDKFQELGRWNEKYWLWWEDVDLCRTAKDRGLKILYTPKTSVIHYEGKSFEQVANVPKQKRFIRGMLTYFYLHRPIYEFLILLIISPISIGLAYLAQILRIKPRPQSKV